MKPVTIYSTPVCPYCFRAKSFFKDQNIPYTETDLASNTELRDELVNKYNWQTVPMIFIGDEFIGGYDNLMDLYHSGQLQTKLS